MTHNTLVLLGHPRDNSFCASLAQTYVEAAGGESSHLRFVRLSELNFDAKGPDYKSHAGLPPDILALQAHLKWAQHIVFVYPIWWGAAPGYFRSLLECTLLPGFAFKYHDTGKGWDKLLSGRTAECIVTMDTPPFIYKWFLKRAGDHVMVGRTLDFCGIKVKRMTHLGPVRTSSPETRETWMRQIESHGREAAGH
jgi:NAD(P)H dehydrogenase (quinone)